MSREIPLEEFINAVIEEALETRGSIKAYYIDSGYSRYFKIESPLLENIFIEYNIAPEIYKKLYNIMLTTTTCKPLNIPVRCEFEIREW